MGDLGVGCDMRGWRFHVVPGRWQLRASTEPLVESQSGSSVAASFGIGRDRVLATPRATLSGRMMLPAGSADADLRWRATSDAGTTSGRGSAFEVQMPQSGTVRFVARIAGSDVEAITTFEVLAAERAVAANLAVSGTVLVDGGRAINGEALAAGAVLDTSLGRATYTARAGERGARSGRIVLEGAEVTLTTTTRAGRVTNHAELTPEAGASAKLVADVEHLDGTRYFEVDTPNAVAMVKGTKLVVAATQFATTVTVQHGWVLVRETGAVAEATVDDGDDPREYDVRAAEQVTVKLRDDAAAAGADANPPARVVTVSPSKLRELTTVPIVQPRLVGTPVQPGDNTSGAKPGGGTTPVATPPGSTPDTTGPRTTTGTQTTESKPTGPCSNFPELSYVPEGFKPTSSGTCVRAAPDLCSNIDGVQSVVPDGLVRRTDGTCGKPGTVNTTTPPPNTVAADACRNIDGVQSAVPGGLIVNAAGECVKPPVDQCPNIPDIQSVIPAGYIKANDGNCVRPLQDLCPNISGIQNPVPGGLIVAKDGNCVQPPKQPAPGTTVANTPPTTGSGSGSGGGGGGGKVVAQNEPPGTLA